MKEEANRSFVRLLALLYQQTTTEQATTTSLEKPVYAHARRRHHKNHRRSIKSLLPCSVILNDHFRSARCSRRFMSDHLDIRKQCVTLKHHGVQSPTAICIPGVPQGTFCGLALRFAFVDELQFLSGMIHWRYNILLSLMKHELDITSIANMTVEFYLP